MYGTHYLHTALAATVSSGVALEKILILFKSPVTPVNTGAFNYL